MPCGLYVEDGAIAHKSLYGEYGQMIINAKVCMYKRVERILMSTYVYHR